MICHLQGVIADKTPTRVTLDVNGVGYEILIPVSTYERIGREGEHTKLLTYLHVREDTLQLFGFSTQKEKWMFSNLITVSGIGPKLALSIISGCVVDNLKHYIINGEVDSLTMLSGVGKKTAQRLITELREKMGGVTPDTQFFPSIVDKKVAGKFDEAVMALVSLGFTKMAAQKALQPVLNKEPELPVEELVKRALQNI
jgi:Holliday junction DNA helicase RuvA